MEFQINVPVLLVAFNRPDTTQIVFGKIREVKPAKLYVAVDGPRKTREGEANLVTEVKQIVQNVDWQCETHYRFNDKNLGAEITVSSAISWVFEKEEYAIILEDDIVAPLSFFRFAEQMLIKYRNEERIATITGSNTTPIELPNDEDYFFAKYGHSWGWATWKRAWKGFDLYVTVPDEHLTMSFLSTITNSKAESRHYKKLFTALKKRGPGNSTWDHSGLYYFRINQKLSIIPRVNLTSNIGIHGLHAKGETEHHFQPVDEGFVVRKHPEKVECNVEFDKHHFKSHIHKKTSFYKRVIRRLKRIINIKI